MSRSYLLAFVTLLGFGALATSPADAAIVYTYVPALTTITASPGATVQVQLFMQEVVSGSDTSFINSQNGLFGAGIGVTRSGSVPASPTTITSISADAGFAGTNNPQVTGGTSALMGEQVDNSASSGPKGTVNGSTRLVPLGLLTLTAGGNNTSTQFTVGPGDGTHGPTLTFANGVSLDSSHVSPTFAAAGTSTFVVVVPEPSVAGLLIGVAASALARRRRSMR